ncbi:MAG TPA: PPC domain-containing DNA-binding protein [Gemmataceae bacterium]|nr:PPC domain-containing DNA-binding protein [Gemmataceae bacterium]
MQSKLLHEAGEKTYAVIFETGEEVVSGLLNFARQEHLAGSHLTAIGALHDVTVGYFNWQKKDYKKIPLNEQVEVLALIGDIALDDKGQPKLHAHIVVGRSDGSAFGGHLMEAHVRPTLEVILVESPKHLQRRHDPETGLALIRVQ